MCTVAVIVNWILLVIFSFLAVSADLQCLSDISLVINPDADVRFTVITSLRSSDGGVCSGKVSVTALQNLGAIQWIVDKMNRENFTKEAKIGRPATHFK